MIQLYHGDGKGKTTASAGAALRAAGRGRPVIFAQFLKGQESGEITMLRETARIRVLRSEKAFPFFADLTDAQKEELTAVHNGILAQIRQALQEKQADFIVLDEITHACRFGLLDESLLDAVLGYGKGADTEIVLTGRMPAAKLLEISDYISEIRAVRHPWEKGVPARAGVEL